MPNSKIYFGKIKIRDIKFGKDDVKLFYGKHKNYPTSVPIDDAVVSCAVATYNGSNQTAQSITVTLSGVTLVEDTDYTVTQNTGGTNAGTYPVVVTGMGNYEGTASGTFTIDKVTPTVTAPTAVTGLVYNASSQALVNAGSTNFGTLKYSLDDSTYTTDIPSEMNATSYTIYYRVDGDSNVNDVAASSIANSIAKVTPTVVAPTAKVLTYNGSAQELVNAGSTNFGTLKYSLDGTTYTTTIPTATNYGSYTVYYKVDGDSNVNSVAAQTVACSINEKQVTATVVLSQTAYTYNGSACQPTVTVKDGTTVIDPSEYTVTYTNNINAGTATVTISDNVGGNYEVIGSTTFTINKADPTYTAPTANNRTYDTTSKALLNAGAVTGGTLYYSSDNSAWSTTIPSQTNAGTYTTYWKITGDSNHNDKSSASISTTVSAKAVSSPTITLSQDSYVYNNTARQPSATVKDGTVTIASSEYTVSYSNNTNVGTATCTITDKTGGNYTVSGSKTFTITCVSCTAPTAKSLTYNGSAQALVNAGSTSFGTMVYSIDNSSWSTSVPSGTNATSYTVYWKVTGNTNVCCTASSSVACSIAKAAMTYTAPSATTYAYGNTARALMSGGTANGGSIQYSTSQTGTYVTTVPTQTNAGTYTTWWKAVPDSNHSGGTNAASVSTIIAKADQSAPTATGATTTYNTTATATASGGGGQGTLTWTNGNTQTSIGSKTTKARWSGNSNYNASPYSNEVTLTMNKAAGSVTTQPTPAASLVYNGYSKALLATRGSGTGTMMYKLDSGSWSTSVPSGTTAGDYTVYYKASASTYYNESTSGSVICSIAKASISPTVSISNWTYGSTPSNPYVYNNTGSGTVTYYYKLSTASSWTTTKPSDAGSYNIRADIAATTNYSSGTCTNNFTINKANSSLSFTVTNLIVEKGQTKANAVTVNAGDGTVTYSSNNTTAITVNNSGVVTGVDSGIATITATISEGTNYKTASASYSASCPFVFTAKFNVTNTSSATKILSGSSNIVKMEIDGVEQPSITTGYTFSTTGEHTVKYYLSSTTFPFNAFEDCITMTSIDMPYGITRIGDYAFAYCTSLKKINSNIDGVFNIPSSVTYIGRRAFAQTKVESIEIPSGVTNDLYQVFWYCYSLTSVTIPSGVTSIGQSVFDSCTSLTRVNSSTNGVCNIPSGVTSIGYQAFRDCGSLTSVTIPSGVTSIGTYGFAYCRNLTSIVCNATTAPTIQSNTFTSVKASGTLTVPIGSSGYDAWMGSSSFYLGYYNWTKVEQ